MSSFSPRDDLEVIRRLESDEYYEDDDTLPESKNSRANRMKRCVRLGVVAALISALGITLGYATSFVNSSSGTRTVPGNGNSVSDQDANNEESGIMGPTPSPAPRFTEPPTPVPPTRYYLIKRQITTELETILGSNTPSFTNAPLQRALNWIVNDDGMQMALENTGLTQRFVIASLWFGMEGQTWDKSGQWASSVSECNWEGITCQNSLDGGMNSQVVTEINLQSNSVKGQLPETLGALPFLQKIVMGQNIIEGSIPESIGRLSTVVHVELWDNVLTGSIPTTIGTMKALRNLYLDGNNLTGRLPTEMGSLSNLKDLTMHDNELVGPLPRELSGLTSLNRFWASNNKLSIGSSGGFPDALLGIRNLNALYIDNNGIEGPIPDDLAYNLPALGDFRANHNRFTGCPPDSLFGMANLKILYLDNNQLECELPSTIYNGPALEELEMFNNKFFGSLPEVSGPPSVVKTLHLGGNRMRGSIPASVNKLTQLRTLDISENLLTGVIPNQLSSLSKLERLFLDDNKFEGKIPNGLQSLTRLKRLTLNTNLLTGRIPNELSELKKIEEMTFHMNSLVGSIPVELCALREEGGLLTELTADCGGTTPEVRCGCCTLCTNTPAGRNEDLY